VSAAAASPVAYGVVSCNALRWSLLEKGVIYLRLFFMFHSVEAIDLREAVDFRRLSTYSYLFSVYLFIYFSSSLYVSLCLIYCH
jgi:hypothetical protein